MIVLYDKDTGIIVPAAGVVGAGAAVVVVCRALRALISSAEGMNAWAAGGRKDATADNTGRHVSVGRRRSVPH